jgi:hypothetical protein
VVFASVQRFESVVRAAQHSVSAVEVEVADSNFVQHSVFAVEVPHVDLIVTVGLAMVELAIENESEKREYGMELMKYVSSPLAVPGF